jgi:hypothetical protein
MATSITATAIPPRPRKPFAGGHPADRNFFLTYVLLIWLAVLAGFIPDMIRHIRSSEPAYPISIHVHAAITLGWLALLTSQTLLVRNGHLRLHRKFGRAGALLAVAVVAIGVWAALSFERLAMGTPKFRPSFLSIEWSNLIEFGVLAAAAISARSQPSAHKRLILLATISLTPAAFNRAIGRSLHELLGSGVLQTFIQIFAATDLLVLGIGAYDLWSRRRVHFAWALGASFIVVAQLTASWLYYNPTWKLLATGIIRSW